MMITYISSIKRSILFLALIFICSTLAHAQGLANIIFEKSSKNNYIGQYNFNGKRKNGFGIERYKNGSLYIGDFVEDKISGRGILISLQHGISGMENAVVYVGEWRDGKKEGKGICYDSNGTAIFKGVFSKDRPTIASDNIHSYQFVIEDIGQDVYIGEMVGNKKEGFALTLTENGELEFGSIKNNVRHGIGIRFYTSDIWEVGKWADGHFTAFNSSQKANLEIAQYKDLVKRHRKETRNSLFEAAGNFAQAALTAKSIVNDIKNESVSVNSKSVDNNVGGEIPTDKDAQFYETEYKKWEWKAKNQFSDRIRHKVTAETHSDGRVATSDAKTLRSYQKMMRNIRLTAKKKGIHIPISDYENASF